MEIYYLGHASFLIKTKTGRLVTDPYDPNIGLVFPKIEAEVVTISHHHSDHNRKDLVLGNPLVIDIPGEYERAGFRIFGYSTFHDKEKGRQRGKNIIYKIETENISLLHCGDLGEVLSEELIDALGEIDILMVPIGGFYTIDVDEAIQIIKKIEPKIIIPMHYNHPQLNQEIFGKLSSVEEFFKKTSIEKEEVEKLVVKKEELIKMEKEKAVVLKIKR